MEYVLILLIVFSIVWSTMRNRVLIDQIQYHSARNVVDEITAVGVQVIPKLLSVIPADLVQSFGRTLLRTMATELFPRPRASRGKKGDSIDLGDGAPWWAGIVTHMMTQPSVPAPEKPEKKKEKKDNDKKNSSESL